MQTSGKLREQRGKLTDDDQFAMAGNQDEAVGPIQQRRGNVAPRVEQRIRKIQS